MEGQRGGGGGGLRLKEHASRYYFFRVYVHVRLLRRRSSTCGWVGGLSTRWVEGEEGGFKELREVGSLLSDPEQPGMVRGGRGGTFVGAGGMPAPLLAIAAFCPRGPPQGSGPLPCES